jgi:hypothetical protein
MEPGLDHSNFRIDLTSQQTESKIRPSLQVDRQSLPVRPEIFERLMVVQLDIRVHDSLNCVRHRFPA